MSIGRAVSSRNPLTLLAVAVFLTVGAYAGPQPWAPLVSLLVALAASVASEVWRQVVALAVLVALPTFVLLFVMNGIVAPEELPLVGAGPLRVAPAAAAPALLIVLRLAAAVSALGWLVLATDPRRLARALAQRGLPSWAAYVLIASLDAVPQGRRRATEVLDAQRARGMRVGKGLGRIRALVPASGPLIVSLVSEAEERALALRARGFRPSGRRTSLDPVADSSAEQAIRLLLWFGAITLVAARFALWFRT